MPFDNLTPDELRELGEETRYCAVLFSPALLAMLLEDGVAVGPARLIGVTRWREDVAVNEETGERYPVLNWTLQTSPLRNG